MADQDVYLKKCFSRNVEDRLEAANLLCNHLSIFSDMTGVGRALIKLVQDDDPDIRQRAVYAFGAAFSQIPEEIGAWRIFQMLTRDKDRYVRRVAAYSLGKAFDYISYKRHAWRFLREFIYDDDDYVRLKAINSLGCIFGSIPDKSLAYDDLHLLSKEAKSSIRKGAALAIGKSFKYIPDKEKAWKDILSLIEDPRDSFVKKYATLALGTAFNEIPHRDQAWKTLQKLVDNNDSYVRQSAADALGNSYCYIPEKIEALKNLQKLAGDKDVFVQGYANYSLGKISVIKAAETDDKKIFCKELEEAVNYFETAFDKHSFDQAKFFYFFYKIYILAIIQEGNEDTIQSYISEAKKVAGGYGRKEDIIKLIENLVGSLRAFKAQKNKSIKEAAIDVLTIKAFCEYAVEIIDESERDESIGIELIRKNDSKFDEIITSKIIAIKEISEYNNLAKNNKAIVESADKPLIIKMKYSRMAMQLEKICRLLCVDEQRQFHELAERIESGADFHGELYKMELLLSNLTLRIELAQSNLSPLLEINKETLADVVILTVKPQEYESILDQLSTYDQPDDLGNIPDMYAWQSGLVECPSKKGVYRIIVGMISRAGNINSALATSVAIQLWRPNYILFCGIAGGLSDTKKNPPEPKLGDIIVADIIYGYEYGKIDIGFEPRLNWTSKTDLALLNYANAYALKADWLDRIKAPKPMDCFTSVISGAIVSGEKVIDNLDNEFFVNILKICPKAKAVEMEGIGIAGAIEQSTGLRIHTGFSVIRGISDLPKSHVFSWDKIPGKDNARLIEFLSNKLSSDWVRTAKIEKIENDMTIKLSAGEKSFLMKLNDEKTKVVLETEDGEINQFTAKVMNHEVNIYSLSSSEDQLKGTAERDKWTAYASASAAAFTIGLIADKGLPIAPLAINQLRETTLSKKPNLMK